MSLFHTELKDLQDRKCLECSGTGKVNDAEPGNITYRSWECPKCGGNGLVPRMLYMVRIPLQPNSSHISEISKELHDFLLHGNYGAKLEISALNYSQITFASLVKWHNS